MPSAPTNQRGSDLSLGAPASSVRPQERTLLFRLGSEQARLEIVDPGNEHESTTTIIPLAKNGVASAGFLNAALIEALRVSRPGCRILSPAVSSNEAEVFRSIGFSERSTLRILLRNTDPTAGWRWKGRQKRWTAQSSVATTMTRSAPATKVRLGRGRTSHVDRCLALDLAAFGPEQAMRRTSFASALAATPHTRFRVAFADSDIVGYAVTGRSDGRGYLQRLAVHPDFASRGIGTQLVEDAILWCDRRRVRRIVVNTQHDNIRALDLYRRLGFEDSPMSLYVLEYPKPSTTLFDVEAVMATESGLDSHPSTSGEVDQ